MHGNDQQTALERFLSANRSRLLAAAGGAAVIGILMATPAPADPTSTIDSTAIGDTAALSSDMSATSGIDGDGHFATVGKWMVSDKLVAVLGSPTPDETFRAASSAVRKSEDLEAIREAIADKRARLEGAMNELENLHYMVEAADMLDPEDREEAVTSALMIYNETLAGAGFDIEAELDGETARTYRGTEAGFILTSSP